MSHASKLIAFVTLIVLQCLSSALMAQSKLEAGNKYLTIDGKPIFINGANYSPSKGWFQILENWDPEAVALDMDSLSSIGVDFIRFMPLWYLTQPEIDKLDQQKVERLNELINIAGKRNIQVQPSLITGWLSSGIFTPSWITKDMFVDPYQIEATTMMVKNIAEVLSINPYVHSYDFGNEINAMREVGGFNGSPEQIKLWMPAIYKAFKSGDPKRLVTNGIGTGYDGFFPIESIAPSCDYMSAHSYPYFHNTNKDDPWFGLRTTYSTNLMIAWAEMAGKPVLMQETGISNTWMDEDARAKYLEMCYFSCWADGAAGFVWWCSHNIDITFRVKSAKDGRMFREEGKFDPLEYEMGLFDVKNNKFPVAYAFKECINFSKKLGLNWMDKLPVCYIIAPKSVMLNHSFRQIINAYVLAKQNHVEVRFIKENTEVPADASFVIIPGISLKGEAKQRISKYLQAGGTVYQSYYNDFAPDIKLIQENTLLNKPTEILITKAVSGLKQLEKFPLAGHLKMVGMSSASNCETILQHCLDCDNHSINETGEGVFFKSTVGKGKYFYTRLNLEESLLDTYNPWLNDESFLFYSLLKPVQEIDIDSKFVEFYHKKNDSTEMIILLNHTDTYQETFVKSIKPIRLKGMRTEDCWETAREFQVKLKPAEVLFLEVKR